MESMIRRLEEMNTEMDLGWNVLGLKQLFVWIGSTLSKI